MDMKLHWLRDREARRQFCIYWRSGKLNLADYHTKNHPASHHISVRHEYLTPKKYVDILRNGSEEEISQANLAVAIAFSDES